jgi:hypothetical protein
MHAQLQALRACCAFHRIDLRARLRGEPIRPDMKDRGHVRKIEHDPAMQRHRLPIGAGARAAHGDGDAQTRGRRCDRHHLVHALRHGHQIGLLAVKRRLGDGAEPVIVARAALQRHRIVKQLDAGHEGPKPSQIIGIAV